MCTKTSTRSVLDKMVLELSLVSRKLNFPKTAESVFTVIRELKRSDPKTFAWNNGAKRYKIYHSPSYISLSFPFNWILCLGTNLSLNITGSNGPRSSESINCELGLRNNEKEKKKKKKGKKVYNCVGKTVHTARGVTMTGGAVYEVMDEQPNASIITLAGFYRTWRHNESERMQTGAVPPQQHTLDFCLRRQTLSTLPSFTESASARQAEFTWGFSVRLNNGKKTWFDSKTLSCSDSWVDVFTCIRHWSVLLHSVTKENVSAAVSWITDCI